MSDEMTGPMHFHQAVLNLDGTFDMEDPYAEDADRVSRYMEVAALHSRLAQTAALVMLTEAVCAASGQLHPELSAWRVVLPVAGSRAEED